MINSLETMVAKEAQNMQTIYEVIDNAHGHYYETPDKQEAEQVMAWYEANFPTEGTTYTVAGFVPVKYSIRERTYVNPLTDDFNFSITTGIGSKPPHVSLTLAPVDDEMGTWRSAEATYPKFVVSGSLTRDEARARFEEEYTRFKKKREEEHLAKMSLLNEQCDKWIDENPDIITFRKQVDEAWLLKESLEAPLVYDESWGTWEPADEQSPEYHAADEAYTILFDEYRAKVLAAPIDCSWDYLSRRISNRVNATTIEG